jgi:hypothetical protein
VIKVGPMVVGIYGGRSAAGAVRNDDSATARFNGFEAAVVADGHHGNDASTLVVRLLSEASDIHQMLAMLQAADTSGMRGATTLIALRAARRSDGARPVRPESARVPRVVRSWPCDRIARFRDPCATGRAYPNNGRYSGRAAPHRSGRDGPGPPRSTGLRN